MVFATNSGDLPITLNSDQAPCTVHGFTHRVAERFYHDTTCHRLTTTAGPRILQCGDPDGNGTGGPGYMIADELPTSLPSAPPDSTGQPLVTCPRGTVAMANTALRRTDRPHGRSRSPPRPRAETVRGSCQTC
ncbi:MAG: peptidylprolyl isomerase [Actinophytocola sp.]|uniref:peptidylprolyl isomerase n=1 Tax=Actinophytocola sp. TaxID=1872138 RepID=UPI003D6A5887